MIFTGVQAGDNVTPAFIAISARASFYLWTNTTIEIAIDGVAAGTALLA